MRFRSGRQTPYTPLGIYIRLRHGPSCLLALDTHVLYSADFYSLRPRHFNKQ